MKLLSLLSALFLSSSSIGLAQFNLTGFAPSQYTGGNATAIDQMRINLGIQFLIIEDFVGLNISPGRLAISGADDPAIVAGDSNSWGATGTGFMRVALSQATGNKLTITVQGGTRKLGLGFSALASGTGDDLTAIAINGGAPVAMNATTLPAFQFRDTFRNGYLIIEAPVGGPLIQQVELSQVSSLDAFQIDFIAYGEGEAVPANPMLAPAVLFKFQSALGVPYIIQGSHDMQNWTDDMTGITGDGKIMKFCFEQDTHRKFYRLKP
jgi:hypothetical protein